MRIHSTTEEATPPPPPTFPSNSNFVTSNSHNNSSNSNPSKFHSHGLNNNNNNNTAQPMQLFGAFGTPFATAANNSPGIPVRIISNSNSPSPSVSHQHSNISPASIISDNASHSQSQPQFSTNVIRSNTTRSHQRPPIPQRSMSPIQSSSTHSYQHIESKLNHEESMYQAQPVLIVHNPQMPNNKVNEYHSQRSRGHSDIRRATESVVILESGGSNSQLQVSIYQKSKFYLFFLKTIVLMPLLVL